MRLKPAPGSSRVPVDRLQTSWRDRFRLVTPEAIDRIHVELLGRLPDAEDVYLRHRLRRSVQRAVETVRASAEYQAIAAGKRESVLFVGNCQVHGIAAWVNALQSKITAYPVELAGRQVDLLETQTYDSPPWCHARAIWVHPHERWNQWLSQQPADFQALVRVLPSISTLGFHPDCVYVWHRDRPIDSPMGQYHSALVLWGLQQGLTARDIKALFNERVFQHLGYFDFFNADSNTLIQQGLELDMPVWNWLNRWKGSGVWMHTINHPKLQVLSDIARHCLSVLGVRGEMHDASLVPDRLATFGVWPVYPEIASALGLSGGSYQFKLPRQGIFDERPVKFVDLDTFIDASTDIYRTLGVHELACDRLDSDAFKSLAACRDALVAAARPAPEVSNPYADLPDGQFWRRAVEKVAPSEIDPVLRARFRIAAADKVATIGSCFAQHVSKALQRSGFHFMVTESADHLPPDDRSARGYGIYSARFGNVYTARQLRQLQEMALGLTRPHDDLVWRREDGRFVDGLRPNIEPQGFASIDEALQSRSVMLAAVADMVRNCDVLLFTMGLTEGWERSSDGLVVPVPPGVVTPVATGESFRFVNFTLDQTVADMRSFLWLLHAVNRSARVVLTVSPVPLVATYEDRSVICSTAHSKAVLRTAASQLEQEFPWLMYFPSYEVITSGPNAGRYFQPDQRNVTDDGVAHVMRLFMKHLGGRQEPSGAADASVARALEMEKTTREVSEIFCDEQMLDAAFWDKAR